MVSKNQIFQEHLAVGSHLLSQLTIKSEGKVEIYKGKERSKRVFLEKQRQMKNPKGKNKSNMLDGIKYHNNSEGSRIW